MTSPRLPPPPVPIACSISIGLDHPPVEEAVIIACLVAADTGVGIARDDKSAIGGGIEPAESLLGGPAKDALPLLSSIGVNLHNPDVEVAEVRIGLGAAHTRFG